MHNLWLIAKREYMERIRTKAFIVSTILLPLLMGAVTVLPSYLATKTHSTKSIAVVTFDAELGSLLSDELTKKSEDKVVVQQIAPPAPNTQATLNRQLEEKVIDGYLWLEPGAGPDAQPKATYYSISNSDPGWTDGTLAESVRRALTRERLKGKGISSDEVDQITKPVEIATQQVKGGKSEASNSVASFFAAFALIFMLYFSIIFYGMNVGRSIIEEKTSRIFEVMLATVKPSELMGGKLLGVGSVGLTQIAIWGIAAAALGGGPVAASAGAFHLHFSAMQLGSFVVFFILGYSFYSALAATLGSMVNSEQELQQMNIFMMLPLIFCMVFLGYVIKSPNSNISVALSLFPPCTPLLMYLRIMMAPVPLWQIALSIVLLIAAIVLVVWIAGRIYRVGILMYGKRPTLPELMRWLRYS